LPESLQTTFTHEILRNVFNETKRGDLCIDEEDILSIKRSERGFSIDEGPELSLNTNEEIKEEEMKLKKTTVLTGNHLVGVSSAGGNGKAIRTRA
jgi:hypothetical protein